MYACSSESTQISEMHSVRLNAYPSGQLIDKMAIPIKLPEDVSFDNTVQDGTKCTDEVDNPRLDRIELIENVKNKIYESMKYEVNRLNSFTGRWPIGYIKPADLAATGLFYLQSDDKVQCAFCHVIIDDWTVGQKPLREHMRHSPKCPFILSSDVGNVPVAPQKFKSTVPSRPISVSAACTPKYPKMADAKSRLMTYREWPRIMLNPKQLTECGLYYTGVADVVTCFYCGGSLGNWELDDNPWVEHEKFFPNCTFLRLLKSNGKLPDAAKNSNMANSESNLINDLHRDVIRQACEVFPKSLVEKAVLKRMSEGAQRFRTVNELADYILTLKEQESKPWTKRTEIKMPGTVKAEAVPVQVISAVSKTHTLKDPLLCKICMDREMGVVFQPCGHLVACPKCADLLFNCPLCRTPVTNKVRTYLS